MENKLRPNMPPLPGRIKTLPIDDRGYPVPWFVAWIDGKPDFRVVDTPKFARAINKKLCWVCGQPIGTRFAFVIGPMCAVNRTSSEPPSHRECAEFSAIACPFLTMPKMVRRESAMPIHVPPPGGMIKRNPGVALVWCTRDYRLLPVDHSYLFQIGDPFEVIWYAEGRLATRQEVLDSIDSGYPLLLEACDQEPTEARQRDARDQLEKQKAVAMQLLPA